jgi:hypothetical protein
MSQFVGTWNLSWANSQDAVITQSTLTFAMKDDGDVSGTFGSGGSPVPNMSFTGSLGDDVVGDGEILSGLFSGTGQQSGFTFVLVRPNFIAGAIATVQFGIAAPFPLFGIRQGI